MLYVMTWTLQPEQRDRVQSLFKETGGAPPEGVRLLGRWHSVAGGKGVLVAESDDAAAMAAWAQQWSGVLSLDAYPAMTDETLANVIG